MANEHQLLDDLRQALLRLAKTEKCARHELFEERPGHSGFTHKVLRRLVEEELVIRTGSGRVMWYEAVDPDYLRKLAEDDLLLSKWLFSPHKTFSNLTEGVAASAVAVEAPVEPVEAPVEPPPPPNILSLLAQLLDTVVLVAENVVYVRKRVDELHQQRATALEELRQFDRDHPEIDGDMRDGNARR